MRFFTYRPTGNELQPRPASIAEVAVLFLATVGAAIGAGICAHHLYGTAQKPLAIFIAGAVLVMLTLWLVIRSVLVRDGILHPLGTLEDAKNHTCCSTRS